MRHTFGSHLAQRGASPKATRELTEHSHVAAAVRYTHRAPAHHPTSVGIPVTRGQHALRLPIALTLQVPEVSKHLLDCALLASPLLELHRHADSAPVSA